MELIRYTNRVIFLVVLAILAVWGTVFYFLVIHEVMDETDDMLNNTHEVLIGKVLHNPNLMHATDSIMQRYSFREISAEEAENYQDTYFDSSVYIHTENEYEPVRVMKSCFRMANGRFYELTLMHSTLERDNLLQTIWWALVVLYVILLVCTAVGVYASLKRVFRPLHRLVMWMQELTPGKPLPELEQDSDIREFRIMNHTAMEMAKRAKKAFQDQKQFTENVSHELQTPLAIIRGKLELLAESDGITEKQLGYVDDMFQALHRVVRINKSLLLLARIDNGQFIDATVVDLVALLRQTMEELQDIYADKQLRTRLVCCDDCGAYIYKVKMNEWLAQVLVTNLLKNAMTHTECGGMVEVFLNRDSLVVANSGTRALERDKLFKRFCHDQKEHHNSTGLGLALVKSIADFYHLSVSYRYEEKHIFELKIANILCADQNS